MPRSTISLTTGTGTGTGGGVITKSYFRREPETQLKPL